MLVEGVQRHHGTTETLVAYEAQFIMHCSQVVDDGPLILSILFHTKGSMCNHQSAGGHRGHESPLVP